jgi:hypothetical protein
MDPQGKEKQASPDKTKPSLEQAYLDQMGPFDRVVFEVAKRQLGMSFDLKRSIGFLEFVSKK